MAGEISESGLVVPKIGEVISPSVAMRLAIAAAGLGAGFVSPNPLVGCVIVDSRHRFLSFGYHAKVGQAHAEIDALKKIQNESQLQGAYFYVTLEPCAHQGRTPSCAKTLAPLGIAGVIYGLQDPNPLVAGQGAQIIRDAGKKAILWNDLNAVSDLGLDADLTDHERTEIGRDLEEVAEIFLWNMKNKTPYVGLKVATTLDGALATKDGVSQWITGEQSRSHVHFLRAHYDAVLVGRQTFLHDNPKLNVRHPRFKDFQNRVVVLDPHGKGLATLAESELIQCHKPDQIFWVVRKGHSFDQNAKVASSYCTILEVSTRADGWFDSEQLLAELWKVGVRSVFVEGGAATLSYFLNDKIAQRLHLFMSCSLLGGIGHRWTEMLRSKDLNSRLFLQNVKTQTFGPDLYVSGQIL